MKKIKKGNILEIKINNIGVEGDGVGRVGDFIVFVKNALPTEKVKVKITKVKRNYARAELLEIIDTAHFRKDPECPHYEECGGCDFMHIQYYKSLEFKKQFLKNNLYKIAKVNIDNKDISAIKADNKLYYRNKAIQNFGIDQDGNIVCGFYKKGTHDIIEVPKCKIIDSKVKEVLNFVISQVKENNIKPYNKKDSSGYLKGLGYRLEKRTNKIMLYFITNNDSKKPLKPIIKKLDFKYENIDSIHINVNKEDNINLGSKNILMMGKDYLDMYLGKAIYKVLPNTFFQINSEQAEKLFNKVKNLLSFERIDIIWDLYGGVGALSFYLSPDYNKLYMFEQNSDSVEIARLNKKINFATNVNIIEANLDNFNFEKVEEPQVILLDPPRKGVSENVISKINNILPKKVIFISCDTATLSRDVKNLKQNYEISDITIVDMFPQTRHVETVMMLERK